MHKLFHGLSHRTLYVDEPDFNRKIAHVASYEALLAAERLLSLPDGPEPAKLLWDSERLSYFDRPVHTCPVIYGGANL
jgi:hypothetical protein